MIDFKTQLKVIRTGILIWLAPIIISFGFYDQEGNLIRDYYAFKVTMVISLLVASYFLFSWLYKQIGKVEKKQAMLFGLVAIAINVVLDMFTIIPWGEMTYQSYTSEIAAFYLLLIPMSVWTNK